MGYRRSKVRQYPNQALLKLENVLSKKDASFYLCKRVAYVYRANSNQKQVNKTKDTRFRVTWGRIAKVHGSGGTVRARFAKNLPPQSFGAAARVMLYPSNI
jgi:large subunit ribosomal protein L35Ae